jgi:signal transduction histidine kinase
MDEVKNYGWREEESFVANGYSYNRGREQFAKIEVCDNGIGFDAAYADKIFEIFQRLHSTKSFEGTGIGLAICKKIVDNHHGMISASSRPGEGTSFSFFLPLSQKSFLPAETLQPQNENAL